MHQETDTDNRLKYTHDRNGTERAVVRVMERFPIDRNTMELSQVEMELKTYDNKRSLLGFSKQNCLRGVNLRRRLAPLSEVHSDLYVLDTREGGQLPSYMSRYCPSVRDKIKSETMRRVRLMVAEQIYARRAEMELSRLTEGSLNGNAQFKEPGDEAVNIGDNKQTAQGRTANSAAVFYSQGGPNMVNEWNEADGETNILSPLVIHGVKGCSSRSRPVVGGAKRDINRRRLFLSRGLLRGPWEGIRDTSIVVKRGLEDIGVLHGSSLLRKPTSSCSKEENLRVHPRAFFPFLRTSLQRLNVPSSFMQGDDLACINVRRILGVPNHDRGLYAYLRAGWKKEAQAKRIMRRLLKGGVQSSSWWMLAGSHEGMLAAAESLGLNPRVYEGLMKRWMWNRKIPENHARSTALSDTAAFNLVQSNAGVLLAQAGDAALAHGTVAHALMNAFSGSTMFSDNDELSGMYELAQQLGLLQMSGVVSAEEITQILEGDTENAQEKINRLLESETVRQQVAQHRASFNMVAINQGQDRSFHELARALLQEKRHTAASAKQRRVKENELRHGENAVSSKSFLGSIKQTAEFQSTESQGLPFIKQIHPYHRTHGADEKLNKGVLIGSEGHHLEREATTPGMLHEDAYFHLPSLRGLCEGQELVYSPGGDRSKHNESLLFYNRDSASMSRNMSCSRTVDSLKATLAPSRVRRRTKTKTKTKAKTRSRSRSGSRSSAKSRSGELTPLHDADIYDGSYTGPEWWKQRHKRPPHGAKSERTLGAYNEDGIESGSEGDVSTHGRNFIKTFDPLTNPRYRRRPKDYQYPGADERSPSITKKYSSHEDEQFVSEESKDEETNNVVRDRSQKVTNLIYDGKLRKRAGFIVTGTDDRRARRRGHNIPPFVRKPKAVSASSPGRKSSFQGDSDERDSRELSSLFADDEEDLVLFLATFPEEELHVRLRHEAKGVLGGLDDESSVLINYAANTRQRQQGAFVAAAPRSPAVSPVDIAKEEEEALRMKVNVDDLRRRFELEARENYSDLWQTILNLRQQVTEQEALLHECEMDLTNLSRSAFDEDRDAFALHLTCEVNKYAKSHRLDSKLLSEATDIKKDYSAAVQTFLNSFAMTRGRRPGRDVGCQCNPEELGYVNEDIRRLEEEMEDLYFHARGLLNAIKLTTIAIGNVMGFHAALELESTCKYCFCIFESPRTLWPCGHTFCQQCLAFMFADNSELICDECGSLCEVGYTQNPALELVASYQIMQHSDHYDDGDEEDFCHAQRRTIEGVLASMMRDLISTQSSIGDSTRKARNKAQVLPAAAAEVEKVEVAM